MDAQAYLIRHGWSGPGNPLNPNRRPGAHSGLGLTRPILVARRQNNHGIGKKTTKDHTNQWWLRGFEDALKGVGQDAQCAPGSESGPGAGSRGGLSGELHKFFVRGDVLVGSIKGGEKERGEFNQTKKAKRKRDETIVRDDGISDESEAKAAKKRTKEAKKQKKEKKGKTERKVTMQEERVNSSTPDPVKQSSSTADDTTESGLGKEERRQRRISRKEAKQAGKDHKERRKTEDKVDTVISDTSDSLQKASKKRMKEKTTAGTIVEEAYPTPAYSEEEQDHSSDLGDDDCGTQGSTTDEKRKKEKKDRSRKSRKSSKIERRSDSDPASLTKKLKRDKKSS